MIESVETRAPGRTGALARALGAVLLVVLGGLVSACDRTPPAGPSSPAAPRTTPLRVVCTTGMIADAAREVGGEHAVVTGLMGEGVDPHLYTASPGDVRLLSEADVVLYNGLNLEGKLGDILVKLARTRQVVAVAADIDPALLRSPPEFEGHVDPHVWFDASLWMKAVAAVRDAMITADPANTEAYRARADRYLQALESLHTESRLRIGSIPEGSRVLVTAHDAFGYFGAAYGLEVRAIQGISTESEASLKDINDLVDLLVTRRIPAVFIESSVPRKAIDALVEGCASRGHTVRIGGELFSDAMGAPGTPEGTFLGMFRHNVETVVSALGGAPAPSGNSGGVP